MEKYEKMIAKAIEELDWDLILDAYTKLKLPWNSGDYGQKSKRKKNPAPSKKDLENELRTLCNYVIHRNLDEYVYYNWLILFYEPEESENSDYVSRDSLGAQIEIVFTLNRSVSFENEPMPEIEEDEYIDWDHVEVEVLNNYLNAALEEENYERAAILRDKINSIKKPVKVRVK